MYPFLGDFELGKTIFFPFHTFNASGASVTISGLSVADIEIYKNASITQRSSDNGYALVDTDGIDIDSLTGIHGFTVDTSDNSDAGFYAAGNDYTVIVSAITVDSQTVSFIAGRFSLLNRAGAGVRSGTLSGTHSSTTADLGTNAPANDISGQTVYFPSHGLSRVIDSYDTGTGVATFSPSVAVTLANGESWILIPTPPASTGAPPTVLLSVGTGTGQVNLSSGKAPATIAAGDLAANSLTASALAADAVTEIQSGLATGANLATVAGYLDTEIAAILADTNELQTDLADGGRLDLLIDAIKAKTDPLTFTVTNQVDANAKSNNDAPVQGDGTSGNKWRGV